MSIYRYQNLSVRDGGDVATVTLRNEGDRYTQEVPPEHRRDLAEELAGDAYRVIPKDAPHGCQWTDDPDEPCPVCGQTLPEWERELLAREAQAAQSDRPEPVDPASVRVGDVVEVVQQHDDIPLRITVEGEVYQLGRDGDSRHLFYIRGYGGPAIADVTTVRVLRPAVPKPDEATVELVLGVLQNVPRAPADISLVDQARELVRRGVRVVSD